VGRVVTTFRVGVAITNLRSSCSRPRLLSTEREIVITVNGRLRSKRVLADFDDTIAFASFNSIVLLVLLCTNCCTYMWVVYGVATPWKINILFFFKLRPACLPDLRTRLPFVTKPGK
jgi:hypothetical protein